MKPIFTGNWDCVNRTYSALKIKWVERHHIFLTLFRIGWLFMWWFPTPVLHCSHILYVIFISFHFRVFFFLSFFLFVCPKCGRCASWKLEKSILMKIPLLLLIPRSIYLCTMCAAFSSFCKLTRRVLSSRFNSFHSISFHFIWFTFLDSIWHSLIARAKRTTKMIWRISWYHRTSLEVSKQYISMRQFHMVVQFTPFIQRQHTLSGGGSIVTIGDI